MIASRPNILTPFLSNLYSNLSLTSGQIQTTTQNLANFSLRTMATQNHAAGYKKPVGNPKFAKFLAPSVWTEFTGLVREHNAVNLGQGFPDYPIPEFVAEALHKANSTNLLHQYTRGFGHPRLVQAIAALYGKDLDRTIDPMAEVLVTTGAYESLYCIIQALVTEGDEVIIIEPFFDCYSVQVGMTGAKPVFVPLKPGKASESGGLARANDWTLDMAQLEAAFSDRTKLIMVNSPNNPLGKVFTREELTGISQLCVAHDVVCISDEVYEWMVYEPHLTHTRMAALPGMWDRTFTVCSAGKTFNTTGWKLGWTIAPNSLLRHPMAVHQNCVYTNATALQEAVGAGLERELEHWGQDDSYFSWIKGKLKSARDEIARSLSEVGFVPYLPQGGYFIMADFSSLPVNIGAEANNHDPKDFQFVRWLIKEKRLGAIPVSAFYSPEHKHIGEKFLRFCFIKDPETLHKAEVILKQWKTAEQNK